MENAEPEARDAFFHHLSLAEEERFSSVSVKRAQTKDSQWQVWIAFCKSLGINQHLENVGPKLPILSVFASQLRQGLIAPSKHSLRANTVADYVCTVAETIASLGTEVDPRFGINGKLHILLQQQYKSYRNDDPPPDRVKPVPLGLILHVVQHLQGTPMGAAKADLIIIAFWFLLRPGEYCFNPDGDNAPFRLQDVSFEYFSETVNAALLPIPLLGPLPEVHLRFTIQKNMTRDEDISHGDTSHPLLSPVKAVWRRVEHLRKHNAPPGTPLHTVYIDSQPINITSKQLTDDLRAGVEAIGPSLNLLPSEISARALRAGGCMALFRANVSATNIRLMGRWRSWAMIEYLHRSGTDTSHYAQLMFDKGNFRLVRHSPLPTDTDVQNTIAQHPEPDVAAGL